MGKDQIISIIRHILSAIGGVLIAYGIGESAQWAEWTGGIMSLIMIIWSFIDKTVQVEAFEGAIRQILTTLGGFLLFTNYLTPERIEAIIAFVMTILPIILGQTSKMKKA